MKNNQNRLTDGLRLLISTILKMLVFMAIVSTIYGYVNGWDKGAKLMGALSLISIIGQCWAHRKDILNLLRGESPLE